MSKWNFKSNYAIQLLKMYLTQWIHDNNEENILKQWLKSNQSYDQIWIQEFSKKQRERRRWTKKRKKHLVNNPKEEKERNVDWLYVVLSKYKGFDQYARYHDFSRDDIINICCYAKYLFYPKGSYIFTKNDVSDGVYGIIKGNVSIRDVAPIEFPIKKSELDNNFNDDIDKWNTINGNNQSYTFISNQSNYKNYNAYEEDYSVQNFLTELELESKAFVEDKRDDDDNDESDEYNDKEKRKQKEVQIKKRKSPTLQELIEDLEYEKTNISNGMCFGDWGTWYGIPRTASAYCLEDTHWFIVEKDKFDRLLQQRYYRSDANKISFILSKMPVFQQQYKFRHLLTQIVPEYYNSGQIVYTEFEPATNVYLLYHGECSLNRLNNARNKEDYITRKLNLRRISTISKGGIIGSECCEGGTYKNTLIITRELTILLKMDYKFFSSVFENFPKFVEKIYNQQKTIFNDVESKFMKIKWKKKENWENKKDLIVKESFLNVKSLIKTALLHKGKLRNEKRFTEHNEKKNTLDLVLRNSNKARTSTKTRKSVIQINKSNILTRTEPVKPQAKVKTKSFSFSNNKYCIPWKVEKTIQNVGTHSKTNSSDLNGTTQYPPTSFNTQFPPTSFTSVTTEITPFTKPISLLSNKSKKRGNNPNKILFNDNISTIRPISSTTQRSRVWSSNYKQWHKTNTNWFLNYKVKYRKYKDMMDVNSDIINSIGYLSQRKNVLYYNSGKYEMPFLTSVHY